MKVIVCDNYDAVSEKAAQLVEAQILENDHSVLGLATGSTPLGFMDNWLKALHHEEYRTKMCALLILMNTSV